MKRLLLLLTLLALPAPAQPVPHVAFSAAPLRSQAGATATLRVTMVLDRGWHSFPCQRQVNAEGLGPAATVLELDGLDGVQILGPARVARTRRSFDPGFNMAVATWDGQQVLEIPVRTRPGAAAGTRSGSLGILCQVCSDHGCLPARRFQVPVQVQLTASGPGLRGLAPYLLLAFLAGLASLLTPCVLPMIPVTVSFFAARPGRTRSALGFGVGIMASYTGLGLILSLALGAAGVQRVAASPLVNLGLAGLFLVLAFSLLGVIEIRIPGDLLRRIPGSGSERLRIFLMGLTFTLTSCTCTAPFVASALVALAQGEWFHPLLGMLSYSAGFALPFVLLALFPAALARLPRSGPWLQHLKVLMGLMEMAAAEKFLSNADLAFGTRFLSRGMVLAVWAACVLTAILYLQDLFPFRRAPGQARPGLARWLASGLAAALLIYLLRGLLGSPLASLDAYLPPSRSPEARIAGSWTTDLAAAQQVAQSTGRPLFLDFTGCTCSNCRWMEMNMFPRPEVQRALADCICVRLQTDAHSAADLGNRRLQQERYGSVELPFYVLVSADARVLATASFTRDEDAFLGFLRRSARVSTPGSGAQPGPDRN